MHSGKITKIAVAWAVFGGFFAACSKIGTAIRPPPPPKKPLMKPIAAPETISAAFFTIFAITVNSLGIFQAKY
jgi:hypothetical protein